MLTWPFKLHFLLVFLPGVPKVTDNMASLFRHGCPISWDHASKVFKALVEFTDVKRIYRMKNGLVSMLIN